MEKGARLTSDDKGREPDRKGRENDGKGREADAKGARRTGVKKLISEEKSYSGLQPRKS